MEGSELIPLSSGARWKEALLDLKHDFSHTWESCYAMYLTTGYNTNLYVYTSGSIKIVCPIAERTHGKYIDIVTPYGFSGFVGNQDFPGFQYHWKSFVRERGYICGYISVNPVLENGTYLQKEEVFRYNTLYFINLTLSRQELFNRLDRNRKRQLRDWSEHSVQIVKDKVVLQSFLLNNYHAFFQRKHASEGYMFSYETLSYITDREDVLMIGFFHNGRIEAMTVFAYTPYIAQALFHVSLPEGKHHTLQLLWYGIIHLKSLGIPVLNLGGGLKEGDSIAQFKERLGADKLPLKSLKQVYDTGVYEALCREVNADPSKRDGYFPAYRKH